MSSINLKPVGERIALVSVDINIRPGRLLLPQNAHRDYVYGKCVQVGSGRYPDGTTRKIYTAVDDVYIYQLDASQKIGSHFCIDGVHFSLVHQADMICKLHGDDVTFDAVEMVGHWILVEPFIPPSDSVIVIPDTAKDQQVERLRFTLVKKGSEVGIDAEIGDEVFPSRGRLTPIELNGKRYCFIQDIFIYGSKPAVAPA